MGGRWEQHRGDKYFPNKEPTTVPVPTLWSSFASNHSFRNCTPSFLFETNIGVNISPWTNSFIFRCTYFGCWHCHIRESPPPFSSPSHLFVHKQLCSASAAAFMDQAPPCITITTDVSLFRSCSRLICVFHKETMSATHAVYRSCLFLFYFCCLLLHVFTIDVHADIWTVGVYVWVFVCVCVCVCVCVWVGCCKWCLKGSLSDLYSVWSSETCINILMCVCVQTVFACMQLEM